MLGHMDSPHSRRRRDSGCPKFARYLGTCKDHPAHHVPHHATPLKVSRQLASFQERSMEYRTRSNNATRFCHPLDFIATSLAASTFRLGRIIPHEVLFSTARLLSVPSADKRNVARSQCGTKSHIPIRGVYQELGHHSVGVVPVLQLNIAVTSPMLEGLSVLHYDPCRRAKSSRPGATA